MLLHMHCTGVRSLQWQPYCLSAAVISTQEGLLNTLRDCEVVMEHSASPMLLLMDVDLHYCVLKLVYGEKTQGYATRALLQQMPPPLFGCGMPTSTS